MKENTVAMMQHRPVNASHDTQTQLLSKLLEVARIDHSGEQIGSRARRDIVRRLPSQLGASTVDDFMSNDISAPRYRASELLLTEAIESTSIIQEQVLRTVIAGAEKFQIIRDAGPAWYNVKSNALRVPLGEAHRNADKVAESTEIKKRTQDYDKRTFTIEKYGTTPDISFEMVEDGLIDTVAEEIFYAGASVENRLNYEALTALATNAGRTTTQTNGATAGNALSVLRDGKKLVKGSRTSNGFAADTIIMTSEFEDDLLANNNLAYASYAGGGEAIRAGTLPARLLGMNWFVTDNGSATVDGTNPWEYGSNDDVGAVVLEAKRGCGVAMRRDRTVKKFDDIVRELNTITVTMRFDVQYMHANAIAKCNWKT